jgi:serine/threonine-protein kinase
MDRFRSLARKLTEAAALGLLATAMLYLPPFEIAPTLDGWLFDSWSRVAPPPAAPEILLARVDTSSELAELTQLARENAARLVVSTLPESPAAASDLAIGPIELPIDDLRSRRTEWPRGGHLWFHADRDGVVRRDLRLTRSADELPSLPRYAATLLDPVRLESQPPGATGRLIRFQDAHSFAVATAAEAFAAPQTLADRIVVAGPDDAMHSTPIGFVSTPALVAQILGSYLGNEFVAESTPAVIMLWIASLALCVPLLLGMSATHTRAIVWIGGAVLGIFATSLLSFHLADLWLPAVGPAAWLLLTGSLLTLRRRAAATAVAVEPDKLSRARRAMKAGRLEESSALYRHVTADTGLLPELYELASSLADQGLEREATDLYYRIAQVDGHFRDVAHRLVQAARSPGDPGPSAEEMPAKVGRYELLEPIGQGAMGFVYLGRDPIINRIVALKAIDLSIGFDHAEIASTSDSFLREATIAGSLSHPNIVTIFDVGEADGLAYIAMEYVRGRHLSDFAAAQTLLPVTTVLELLSRAADGLHYAHSQNVVHRDIKPANIMYDSHSNNLKITDFGIAKLIDANRTRTGIVLGTPAFMSPEQLEGKNVNGHTDLFALGVSLYQLLTGQLPFRGASMTNLMFVIANEPHRPITSVRPDLPEWLDAVVDRALAKDPADRFESGAEMAAALRRAA